MKKTLHMAKANILKNKGSAMSLFAIITIVSMMITTGLTISLGIQKDFMECVDRMNGMHNFFVMDKGDFNPVYEDVIKEDPRVSQYEIIEAYYPTKPKINYGGEAELINALIFNLDAPMDISGVKITEQDISVPADSAIYLTVASKGVGYKIGDLFVITYHNKQIPFTIAGFFETSEFGVPSIGFLEFFVPDECFEKLGEHFTISTMITIRLFDINDSEQFNLDFTEKTDTELSSFSGAYDYINLASGGIAMVSMAAVVIIAFALIFVLIYLLVASFRISNTIENAMREIGVLKATGYTSKLIINCYVLEYGIVALPAALLGVLITIPLFPVIRQILASMTGSPWTLGTNVFAGIIASLLLTVVLLLMVKRSCHRIRKLPPVEALRGGITANNFRRNFFPLSSGKSGVHVRLGLKNMLAFFRSYVMIGIVIAGVSLMVTFTVVLYQNFVVDNSTILKASGMEDCDVQLAVVRHTDAFELAADIEKMPEVRKTSMFEAIRFDVDKVTVNGYLSDNFDALETVSAHDGRLPKHFDEIAIPKLLADQLGKKIGSTVIVTVNGVSQEYIITGFFSTLSYAGKTGMLSLEGYQRLDPNYKRNNINVHFNEGVTFAGFSDQLKENFGVLNVHMQNGESKYPDAQKRAEEIISTYLEQYSIDSVEYAVIYDGEIVIQGSSSAYKIESIIDFKEFVRLNIGSISAATSMITQIFAIISLIIISLVLSMTISSIITKRRCELGIMKSSGYTTKQLARQLAISFMPMTAIGAVIGCALGASTVGPVISAAFAGQGAYGMTFATNPLTIALAGLIIIVVTYFVANFFAMRIKKISVYELISE